jgi:hypothetical protein
MLRRASPKEGAMEVFTYDIFSGLQDKNAMWVESVEGLRAAYERMKEIAAKTRGRYFVFCTRTNNVVASVDTTREPKAKAEGTIEQQIGVPVRRTL